MNTSEALLYARTVRHLRPVQILGRARRVLTTSSVDRGPAPALRGVAALAAPARRTPVLLAPTRVSMLGEQGDLAAASDWHDPSRSALWNYHIHYFDDLRADGAASRAEWNDALIQRWIDENKPGVGTGWDSYPTSLRIVNWARWGIEHGLTDAAVHSLGIQARHLRANLEWHLLGNHLLANAKALVFAGAFFEGREASGWLDKGLALLRRELAEQVLDDGGHFERSPMYHSLVLEDVLDLIALVRAAPTAFARRSEIESWLGSLADHMRDWLAAMVHPDGEIALFNDAAIGQAPAPAELADYAERVGRPAASRSPDGVTFLGASGYVRVASGPMVALLDVGEIGPSYLTGHSHADSLTFELSLDGERLIVDSGTSVYEPGDERLRQRSTAAHNTVEIDGADSSEIWSSFRVARRARPLELCIDETTDGVTVSCAHDGYRRLPGRVGHSRTWSFTASGLAIHDRIEGRFETATARLHLHPEVNVAPRSDGVRLTSGGRVPVDVRAFGARIETCESSWHPGFGRSVPTSHLRHVLSPGVPQTTCHIAW